MSTSSRRARGTTSRGETTTRRVQIAFAASPCGVSRTSQTRDFADFTRYSEWIFQNPHEAADEMEWLKRQGPWSPGLIEYLKRHHKQYESLIFYNYLYAPTVLGLQVDPARSILVPAAHDEPPIHLDIYRDVFRLPKAIGYLSEPERRFVAQLSIDQAVDRGNDRLWRRPAAPSRISTRRSAGRARPTTEPRPNERRPRETARWRREWAVPVACVLSRRGLQAASSHPRSVRVVRRPNRSGKRVRRADRVLQQLCRVPEETRHSC